VYSWTLQELLAPGIVTFCNRSWQVVGTLQRGGSSDGSDIAKHVSLATGIEQTYLQGGTYSSTGAKSIMGTCIAKKFSWAARRKTERPEDMAYCLLGLVDVNMPLLYGEGGQRAFMRLQQEIIRQSDDESIFAWRRMALPDEPFGLLAPEIRFFRGAGDIEATDATASEYQHRQPYSVTNKGLMFETPAYPVQHKTATTGKGSDTVVLVDGEEPITLPTIRIRASSQASVDVPLPLFDVQHEQEDKVIGKDLDEDVRYLIPLNCHHAPLRPAAEDFATPGKILQRLKSPDSETCGILIREGPGNVAYRVMVDTLHPDVAASTDPVPRRFLVKLMSAY
jgi:hypothetical protein